VLVHGLPQALHEAERTLHALVGPLERLLGRRREHHEQARGIGAVALHELVGVHAVALGLGHRADAAAFDRLAVGTQHGTDTRALLVHLHVDVGRVVVDDASGRRLAVEDLVQDHALRQQVAERLVERR
jgi:hypothetical protein